MARTTLASLAAQVEALTAALAAAQAATPAAEASQHYTAKDLPCTAATPCGKTFRTVKGVAWHVANVKHA
ncbi:MAG TPA: hypothetical protein VFB99_01645 [Vicinamibacterales bacterium]|nr:hypothetical protein [Vicinamibacterales bacterium]